MNDYYNRTTEKVKKFKDEIIEVCKKHNLSISHEDCHGGFKIEDYNEWNTRWFLEATDETQENKNVVII